MQLYALLEYNIKYTYLFFQQILTYMQKRQYEFKKKNISLICRFLKLNFT